MMYPSSISFKQLSMCFALAACWQYAQAQSDLVQLRTLNARFIHNFVTNDTASHSKIIHRDFVCINSVGAIIPRQEYLNEWTHGFNGCTYWDYREEQIRIFGNMALVRAMNKYTFVVNGKTISGMSIYTDTYVKEKGQWLCVQAQITPVAPENYRGDNTIIRKYEN